MLNGRHPVVTNTFLTINTYNAQSKIMQSPAIENKFCPRKKALKNQSINKLIKYRQSMSRRMYNVSLNKKICR